MHYLDAEYGAEAVIAEQVLKAGDKLWAERVNEFLKGIESAVQSGVAKALGG